MGKKRIFLYRIMDEARNIISFTCDTQHAEKMSKKGYRVTTPPLRKRWRGVI